MSTEFKEVKKEKKIRKQVRFSKEKDDYSSKPFIQQSFRRKLSKILLVCIFMQFVIIAYILCIKENVCSISKHGLKDSLNITKNLTVANTNTNKNENEISGQAAILMLHEPKWFQRRYTMMIHNVLSNIPSTWKIQIFYTNKGQSKAGIDLNYGLQKLIKKGIVILTLIPTNITKFKKKTYQLITEQWLWDNMIAEHILLFGGNSVICSNSPYTIMDFIHYDYLGTPWETFNGVGGYSSLVDGGMSIRSKSSMLNIIHYNTKILNKSYPNYENEGIFFIKYLLLFNQFYHHTYKIASKLITQQFATTSYYYNLNSFIAYGILNYNISYSQREDFLLYCPELRMLFPALTESGCYIQKKYNITKCKSTICALQDFSFRKGKGGCGV